MAKILGAHVKSPNTAKTAYSLTIGAVTTPPTPHASAVSTAQWHREGEYMVIEYEFHQTGAGSPGSGFYLFPLPPTYVMDTSKIITSTNTNGATATILGPCYQANGTSSGSGGWTGNMTAYNSTNLMMHFNVNATSYQSFGQGGSIAMDSTPVYMSFRAVVPIVGWASSDILRISDDTKV